MEPTTYKKTCQRCGRTFTTKIFWAKFCSTRCKIAAWRKQQKKQAAEPIGKKS